jgi:dolichyl-phosphate-mannose-protein mannosyltransferase
MASEKGTVVSGLDLDSQSTRRRNVPPTSPNGGQVNKVEIDNKKTQAKVSVYEAPKFAVKIGKG